MRLLTKQTPSPVSPKRGSPEESHRSFTNHLQTDFIMFKTMIVKSIGGGIALAILLLSSTGLKAAVTHSGGSATQQQQPKTRILSGTVLDAVTNEPVIGAAVQVRGRQGGEITDLDGMFTIDVPSGAVITVTSLGYRSQSLKIGRAHV